MQPALDHTVLTQCVAQNQRAERQQTQQNPHPLTATTPRQETLSAP